MMTVNERMHAIVVADRTAAPLYSTATSKWYVSAMNLHEVREWPPISLISIVEHRELMDQAVHAFWSKLMDLSQAMRLSCEDGKMRLFWTGFMWEKSAP